MKFNLLLILIGTVAGFIGIIPLIKRHADKYLVSGSFVFYFLMSYVIRNLAFPFVTWWLKGAVVTLILSLPLLLAAGKGNRRCVFPLVVSSLLVGGLITLLHYYLL